MYKYVYGHVHVCMCVHMEARGQPWISWGSVHFVFGESVSFKDLGFTQLGWQAGESHGSSCAGITSGPQPTWLSIWMLGIQLRSHACVAKLNQLSCLVCSTSYKFFNHLKVLKYNNSDPCRKYMMDTRM